MLEDGEQKTLHQQVFVGKEVYSQSERGSVPSSLSGVFRVLHSSGQQLVQKNGRLCFLNRSRYCRTRMSDSWSGSPSVLYP